MFKFKKIFSIKILGILSLMPYALCLTSCSKPDPILPGTRTAIFNANTPVAQNVEISNADKLQVIQYKTTDCNCKIDSKNIISCNDKKIFSGFATTAHIKSERAPICDGVFLYAGLSTGELVRVNRNTREISWITDVYKPSNMLGGSAILDIIAPITITKSDVYAGGIGDAFCKINKSNGNKRWCVYVGAFVSCGVGVLSVSGEESLRVIVWGWMCVVPMW